MRTNCEIGARNEVWLGPNYFGVKFTYELSGNIVYKAPGINLGLSKRSTSNVFSVKIAHEFIFGKFTLKEYEKVNDESALA